MASSERKGFGFSWKDSLIVCIIRSNFIFVYRDYVHGEEKPMGLDRCITDCIDKLYGSLR